MKDKKAILIVDDDAIILLAMKQELMRSFGADFIMETALCAAEAYTVIDELVEDGVLLILIISDWLMPDVKGDELLASVKSRHPDVRCIIVSGQADPEAIARARERVHLDAFIRKPWSRNELLSAVGACLDREP